MGDRTEVPQKDLEVESDLTLHHTPGVGGRLLSKQRVEPSTVGSGTEVGVERQWTDTLGSDTELERLEGSGDIGVVEVNCADPSGKS